LRGRERRWEGGKGEGRGGRGGEKVGDVERPGMWSAPGTALAIGGPYCSTLY